LTTVPVKVWLPSGLVVGAAAEPEGLALWAPESGAVAPGVEEAGGCALLGGVDGLCEDWSGALLGGCEVDGLCDEGEVDDGEVEDGLCVDWSGVLLGVLDDGVCALGVCCEAGGISGDGVGCVCGVC
jgi:hypothetical protein